MNLFRTSLLSFLMLCFALPSASFAQEPPGGLWTPEGRDQWIRDSKDVDDPRLNEDQYYVDDGQEPAAEDTEQLGPESYDADNPDESVPFWDELNNKGAWVWTEDLGWVWMPSDRDEDWKPYTHGQWHDSDEGWYFESDEDYGPIVYHYGRWVFAQGYGWVWVPGRTWASSWVHWRVADGYVGWAPIVPYFYLTGGGYSLGYSHWSFVERRHFFHRGLHRWTVPRYRTRYLYRKARRLKRWRRGKSRRAFRGPKPGSFKRHVKKMPKRRMAKKMRKNIRPKRYLPPKAHPQSRKRAGAAPSRRVQPGRSAVPRANRAQKPNRRPNLRKAPNRGRRAAPAPPSRSRKGPATSAPSGSRTKRAVRPSPRSRRAQPKLHKRGKVRSRVTPKASPRPRVKRSPRRSPKPRSFSRKAPSRSRSKARSGSSSRSKKKSRSRDRSSRRRR